ncbi:hypothetical protein [Dictyobacter kobayashii]|uniref:hypothetical protein n=1 Tax=Dictyobacter kobayashii TaxID=2014872 RepID=UPI000F833BA3|nr:hypothetical protein [Dictyobacter kobayashii]
MLLDELYRRCIASFFTIVSALAHLINVMLLEAIVNAAQMWLALLLLRSYCSGSNSGRPVSHPGDFAQTIEWHAILGMYLTISSGQISKILLESSSHRSFRTYSDIFDALRSAMPGFMGCVPVSIPQLLFCPPLCPGSLLVL